MICFAESDPQPCAFSPGKHWVLKGHEPVYVDMDTEAWANCFTDSCQHVADDQLGDVRVSTVFLALDHNFSGEGPPLLFETMVFGGVEDGRQWRYSTWREAEEGHAVVIQSVRQAMKRPSLIERWWRWVTGR